MTYGIPTAPQALQDYYSLLFRSYGDTVARVFAWIETFRDSHLTGGLHVQPLIEQAQKANQFAIVACTILSNHNQELWLYERMTFHGLADIQGCLPGELRAFARDVKP